VAVTDILSRFLQNNCVKCYLGCIYNYFSSAKVTTNKNLWRGSYYCTNEDCDIVYIAIIKCIEKNGDVNVVINSEGECFHETQNKTAKIKGNDRKEIGKTLVYQGSLNVRAKHIIENHKMNNIFDAPKVTNSKNLNNLKSQFRNSERFSTKIFEDLSLVKQVYDYMISETIQGYVHFISMFPFGFLLYMEKQVNILKQIIIFK
jgi:hypothetical protein